MKILHFLREDIYLRQASHMIFLPQLHSALSDSDVDLFSPELVI